MTKKMPEIIGSDTVMLDDEWLYRWCGRPPRDFCLHKSLFRPSKVLDIVAAGWQVLTPAVSEMTSCLGMNPGDTIPDWLKLDAVHYGACRLGIHADRTVVAAAPYVSSQRPFIPYRYYETLAGCPEWKDVHYSASYRHFVARFRNGITFYTDRDRLLCELEYVAHFGVHGNHTVWPMLRIGDRVIAVPKRVRIGESQTDLPGKVDRLARWSRESIAAIGASWLRQRDEQQLWHYALNVLKGVSVPLYKLNELRNDPELLQCLTKLDMLLCLSKLFRSDSMVSTSNMLKLSNNLFTREDDHA